jgi:hypothetical protein
MLTANYLSDIISGLIDNISVCLEVEQVLFEILMSESLLINEDDIRHINIMDQKMIYSGPSYRYIILPSEELPFTDQMKIIDKRFSELSSCYFWSKTLLGLNKSDKHQAGEKFLVSSDVKGLDMFRLTNQLVRLSKTIKKQGYTSKYDEFYKMRSNYKKFESVVAPNGTGTKLQLT